MKLCRANYWNPRGGRDDFEKFENNYNHHWDVFENICKKLFHSNTSTLSLERRRDGDVTREKRNYNNYDGKK